MNQIKMSRLKRNFTQTELSRKSKVAQSTIHYIESGTKSPTERTLKKLAAALDVDVSELIQESEATRS